MKFSSSFKVGLLTLISLSLLVVVVLRVKGRSFSSADRIEIQFKDVNGMRPGAGVQMMGLKVGQVEDIIPVINGEDNHVNVKFVITNPDITIPTASTFSIQQSGLIGELFLEITPPITRTIYIPMIDKNVLYQDDPVEMKLDDKYYDVGKIKNIEVLSKDAVPYNFKEYITTNSAYKVDYVVNLPGLILPEFMKGKTVSENGTKKLRISTLDDVTLPYPKQDSPYTIIEPMRIADFMDWQYRAAESLTETNRKINELLSDDVITDLKNSGSNINRRTTQTTKTMTKVDALLDSSREDLDKLMAMMEKATNDFSEISANINNIIGDKEFKENLKSTTKSIEQLSDNLNTIMGNGNAEAFAEDLKVISHNVNEISTYVNSLTKDDQLKKDLTNTVANINKAMSDISTSLAAVNKLGPDQRTELEKIIENTEATTCNLRKFSEKLNKRFLLFRLMF